MSVISHVRDHAGKYSALGGVLAFAGQLGYHVWETSFDHWFWDRYVRGVEEKCSPPAIHTNFYPPEYFVGRENRL